MGDSTTNDALWTGIRNDSTGDEFGEGSNTILKPGLYRVIDGQLCCIVPWGNIVGGKVYRTYVDGPHG